MICSSLKWHRLGRRCPSTGYLGPNCCCHVDPSNPVHAAATRSPLKLNVPHQVQAAAFTLELLGEILGLQHEPKQHGVGHFTGE